MHCFHWLGADLQAVLTARSLTTPSQAWGEGVRSRSQRQFLMSPIVPQSKPLKHTRDSSQKQMAAVRLGSTWHLQWGGLFILWGGKIMSRHVLMFLLMACSFYQDKSQSVGSMSDFNWKWPLASIPKFRNSPCGLFWSNGPQTISIFPFLGLCMSLWSARRPVTYNSYNWTFAQVSLPLLGA